MRPESTIFALVVLAAVRPVVQHPAPLSPEKTKEWRAVLSTKLFILL